MKMKTKQLSNKILVSMCQKQFMIKQLLNKVVNYHWYSMHHSPPPPPPKQKTNTQMNTTKYNIYCNKQWHLFCQYIIFLIAIEKKIKCDTEVFEWDYMNQNEN